MRILVIGSGGREHALVKALQRSPGTEFVACAPGSDGIAVSCECVDIFAHTDILNYCRTNTINLVVVGPETPLVNGLADDLRKENIAVFGPSAKAAQLEASKAFTKDLCKRYGIPTAEYEVFENREEALAYAKKKGAPIVIKADGLASGKGVTVAMTPSEAHKAIEECFDGAFGDAGTKVVIEEFMVGDEASFFALCDGKTAVAFGAAQDHKRAFDGDKGPNTGGMGTYSPTPFLTADQYETVMQSIIRPTLKGLQEDGIEYNGVLFAGLMMTKTGPKLIEYNCRFGDPETQVLLARFKGDLAALLMSCATGAMDEKQLQFGDEAAVCVVMANNGYPGKFERGHVIQNLDRVAAEPNVALYHAGTQKAGEQWVSHGGRVLNIVATGGSLRQARLRAYDAVEMVQWPEGFCRKDIGAKALGQK